MFESIRLEKAFQEDHARGGSGILASAGSTDCAAAAQEKERKAIHTAERHPLNAFLIRQIISLPHLPVTMDKVCACIALRKQLKSSPAVFPPKPASLEPGWIFRAESYSICS
jgi:hypothetical protein